MAAQESEPDTAGRPSSVAQDDERPAAAGSSRAPVACLICRGRRVRCDGQRPACRTCLSSGRECEWPLGRKRKRTKREKLDDEARRQRDAALSEIAYPLLEMATGGDARIANASQLSMGLQRPIETQASSVLPGPQPSGRSGIIGTSTPVNVFDPLPSTTGSDNNILPEFEQGTQTAFLRGEPGQDADLELYYYRFAGATAIQPGIHRIALRHQSRSTASPLRIAQRPIREARDPSPASDLGNQFDADGFPYPHVWGPLFEKFLQHYTQFFPSISRQRMIDRIESGTMSRFLSVAICALAGRHADEAASSPTGYCAPFLAKAQELATPLLQLPTTDTCTGLMLLCWAYYGQGSESGAWQYSGMAIRMAVELGVHEVSDVFMSPAHVVRTRLLRWSLYLTDRVVHFAYGRPTLIRDETIEIPFPQDSDFFPDPARDIPSLPMEMVEPVPFVYLTRLMVICGRVGDLLNVRRGPAFHLARPMARPTEGLRELQANVLDFFRELPEPMRWSVDHLKHQHLRGHGSAYLTIHLWGNALLTFLNHAGLMLPASGTITPRTISGANHRDMSLATAKQIGELISVAHAVSPTTYTSAPFTVQPLFIAGLSLASETGSNIGATSTTDPQKQFMLAMASQGVVGVLTALSHIAKFYASAGVTARILEKRSGVLRAEHPTDVDPSIPLPDMGLLRRFTIDRDHPKGLAPPTDTSLRDYMARSERDAIGSDTNWITDLLSDYELDSLSFFPDDIFNLGSLPDTNPSMLNAAHFNGASNLSNMSHSEGPLPDAL